MKKYSFIILVIAVLSVMTITSYAAGGGSSSTKQSTVNGYTYNYYAGVYAGKSNGTPYANSSISIRTSPTGTNVPSGWMYAQAKLYTHSGVLKATAVANTNGSSTYYLNGNFASLKPASANTLYYGKGTVGFWNGTSYSYYTTYSTPSYQP